MGCDIALVMDHSRSVRDVQNYIWSFALKLIDNVRQVAKINIGYSQKPKVVDIKKLKSKLWTEISGIDEKRETIKPDDSNAIGPGPRQPDQKPADEVQTFTQMLDNVPQACSAKMAESLSVSVTNLLP